MWSFLGLLLVVGTAHPTCYQSVRFRHSQHFVLLGFVPLPNRAQPRLRGFSPVVENLNYIVLFFLFIDPPVLIDPHLYSITIKRHRPKPELKKVRFLIEIDLISSRAINLTLLRTQDVYEWR